MILCLSNEKVAAFDKIHSDIFSEGHKESQRNYSRLSDHPCLYIGDMGICILHGNMRKQLPEHPGDHSGLALERNTALGGVQLMPKHVSGSFG